MAGAVVGTAGSDSPSQQCYVMGVRIGERRTECLVEVVEGHSRSIAAIVRFDAVVGCDGGVSLKSHTSSQTSSPDCNMQTPAV